MGVRISTGDLRQLIRQAGPFASTDKHLPLLNTVHLVTGEGWLWAEATDRYVAAGARSWAAVEGDLDVVLPSRVAGELSRLCKRWEHYWVYLDVECPGSLTVSLTPSQSTARTDEAVFSFEIPTDEFPPVRPLAQLDRDRFEDPVAKYSAFETKHLAKLAKLSGKGVLVTRGTKPATFVADDAWAVIMPARFRPTSEEPGMSGWSDAVSALKAKGGAK